MQTSYLKVTNRELQVLQSLSKGLSAKEIAGELSISPLTVEKHKQNMFHKLEARNSTQLILKAERLGLLIWMIKHHLGILSSIHSLFVKSKEVRALPIVERRVYPFDSWVMPACPNKMPYGYAGFLLRTSTSISRLLHTLWNRMPFCNWYTQVSGQNNPILGESNRNFRKLRPSYLTREVMNLNMALWTNRSPECPGEFSLLP